MGGPGGLEDFIEGIALSSHNTELAKKNQHHHRLGPDGYYGKEEQFRKMEEEAATSGSFDLSGLKVRSRNWILGRSTSTKASSGLKFSNLETEQAVSEILKYAKDKEKGSFRAFQRERERQA